MLIHEAAARLADRRSGPIAQSASSKIRLVFMPAQFRPVAAVCAVLLLLSVAMPHPVVLAQDPPSATETPLPPPPQVEVTATIPPVPELQPTFTIPPIEYTPPPVEPPPAPPVDPNAPTADPNAVPVNPLPPTPDPNATVIEVPTAQVEVVATPVPPPPEPTEVPIVLDAQTRIAQVGETLGSISAQTAFSQNALAQANSLTRGDLLIAGQSLTLPGEPALLARVHRVAPGDTVLTLAAQHGITPQALRVANRLRCDSCLIVGQILTIPTSQPVAVGAAPSAAPAPFVAIKIGPALPKQGDVIVISVTTQIPLQSLVGSLAGRPLTFVQKNGAYLALSGVGAIQDAGVYSVTLRAITVDGVPASASGRMRVAAGQFAFENLTIGQKLAPLLAVDVNLEERAALDGIFNRNFTGAQYWKGPLADPIQSRVISYYGTRRNFNRGTLNTFHSGIDMPARMGTAVGAAAPGRVVAVQEFPIRGNVVIIDHGRGVFTIYCHLSRFAVQVGDQVDAGGLLGYTGSTGRSLGPHLHFELAVGGVTVNPLPWLKRELP
jgi:murein DD-endopeptidase MepM/ murein hydrolase activator NlpD